MEFSNNSFSNICFSCSLLEWSFCDPTNLPLVTGFPSIFMFLSIVCKFYLVLSCSCLENMNNGQATQVCLHTLLLKFNFKIFHTFLKMLNSICFLYYTFAIIILMSIVSSKIYTNMNSD